MELSDLIRIPITEFMIKEAEIEEQRLEAKSGFNTRTVRTAEGEVARRNLTGSLAHQAVEIALDNLGVPYKSFRNVIYAGGDCYDIEYEDDRLDVKGVSKCFNDKYFFNESFLVFKQQLDDPKMSRISHFVFVLIDKALKWAWIYGVIGVSEFMKKATDVTLTYENKSIKAYNLRPFRKYVYRVA